MSVPCHIVEGFYGPPYHPDSRDSLICWASQHNFSRYVYAPMFDRYLRDRWWEMHDQLTWRRLQRTIRVTRNAGMEFEFALSPIRERSNDDADLVWMKVQQALRAGAGAVTLRFDDAEGDAYRQSALTTDLFKRLQFTDPTIPLTVCPRIYAGVPPFDDDLIRFARPLDRRIAFYYTGPAIVNTAISGEHVRAFRAAVGERPIVLWENLPVNDLRMRGQLKIGPLEGRDVDLAGEVAAIAANVMMWAEASKVTLFTIAAWAHDPQTYVHAVESFWNRAIEQVGGWRWAESLRVVGLHLRGVGDWALAQFVERAVDGDADALRVLASHLDLIDTASYELMMTMGNAALRAELLPWLEELRAQIGEGRHALRALESGRPPPIPSAPNRIPPDLQSQWLPLLRRGGGVGAHEEAL